MTFYKTLEKSVILKYYSFTLGLRKWNCNYIINLKLTYIIS